LPLDGWLDLTYRCNNDCRHCWLRLPATSPRGADELSLEEIRRIADQSRQLGCRRWGISGGEPMLRPDFAEIFSYLTARSNGYTLNTNGTLITPAIARLLVRKGAKMVALYGATAQVHDHITRTPGSFEATMRGIAYLREAGAGFVVQVVPLRDSWHQFREMLALAQSLSAQYRIGAAWLNLSGGASPERNAEIARQRLDPKDVIDLDPPEVSCAQGASSACRREGGGDDRLFAACILGRTEFHVDPYGGLSFCSQIRDPALRFDLRRGDVRQAWDGFLPGLADRVRGGAAYAKECGACDLRDECRWCGAHAHLEHGDPARKVEYLCDVARAGRDFSNNWQAHHRRFFLIAGVTVQVDADVPIADGTFAPKFSAFSADGPGSDTIRIHHHFGRLAPDRRKLGKEISRRPPWVIFRKSAGWIYVPMGLRPLPHVAEFNQDHSEGWIRHRDDRLFRAGGLESLVMVGSDQLYLTRALAERQACYFHSSAVVAHDAGLLFVGHSRAGKSTAAKLLRGQARILCDDRNIVRRWPDGFYVHGTWSHGEIAEVSSASAPLAAILLPRKSEENRLVRIEDPRRARNLLLGYVIKGLVDRGWWEKILDVVQALSHEVPCYEMHFDRSGTIVSPLLELARGAQRRGPPEDARSVG
jgi:MoaA/NifB/PqqE/SkfB family radical SAM enzyme